ncbi:carbohydrate binding protein [Rathayibacter sp. PhB93]|uniref:carbohydrate-binding protein n=1 Tax=unclassified Rathayibacter TaxID=2609250 RepID=UPI000F45F347|nr:MULTISPECIES: carbohydrate-binding protein [unclassified Rathayibacter]ROQ16210.1 carbohydrate binding protein [Rathayibacter sp. PhB93]TDQ16151.1 carbohydrate binding protein [Rathayibacter sp. PhB1]
MRTRIRCTIAGLTTLGLLAGGAVLGAGPAFAQTASPVTSTATATSIAAPEWSATATYTGGQQVTRQGKLYTAGWWTRGEDPLLVSGTVGTGKVWQPATGASAPSVTPAPAPTAAPAAASTPTAAPAPTRAPAPVAAAVPTAAPAPAAAASNPFPGVAAWSASATYTGGQQVVRDGKLYTAGWWTLGADPRTESGAIGSGKVWQPASAVAPAPISTPAPTTTPVPAKTAVPTPSAATDPAKSPGTAAPVTGTSPAVLRSGYKDITINMDWNTHQLRTAVDGRIVPLVGPDSWASRTGSSAVTLAFASGTGDAPNWAGVTADEFRSSIDQLVAADVDYVLATGGASAVFTANAAQLDSFISRYASKNLIGIDFDIERGQTAAQIRELADAAAVAEVKYPNLRFQFTLPTAAASDGSRYSLTDVGVTTVEAIKASGVQHYTVNLMAMDYGLPTAANAVIDSTTGRTDMGASAIQAARNVHEKHGIPYSKLELTAMIGVNDVTEEVTSVADFERIAAFVKTQGLAGLHHWSVDRDTPSTVGVVSPTGSGTAIPSGAFAAVVNRAG